MHAHLAMLHQAVLAAMHKFNRVFHRDDVIVAMQVRVIHHRRQGGRFTRAGGPRHQNEPLLQHRKFFEDWREPEVLHSQYLRRNQAKHGRDSVFLLEEIRAITRHAWNFVTEIDIGSFFEDLDLPFRGDLINHRLELVVFERGIIHADELAVDAEHGRITCGEMKVGCLLLSHELEEWAMGAALLKLNRCH